MKDNAGRIIDVGTVLALFAVFLAAAGCSKSDKAADVAQDSILVKDADIGDNKTDTAGAATAALLRAHGSAADEPVLTTGAPVKRAPAVGGPASSGGLKPPKRVNPTPVLPGRESTSTQPSPAPKRDSTKGDTLSLIL
jgi:hypothetical protein